MAYQSPFFSLSDALAWIQRFGDRSTQADFIRAASDRVVKVSGTVRGHWGELGPEWWLVEETQLFPEKNMISIGRPSQQWQTHAIDDEDDYDPHSFGEAVPSPSYLREEPYREATNLKVDRSDVERVFAAAPTSADNAPLSPEAEEMRQQIETLPSGRRAGGRPAKGGKDWFVAKLQELITQGDVAAGALHEQVAYKLLDLYQKETGITETELPSLGTVKNHIRDELHAYLDSRTRVE